MGHHEINIKKSSGDLVPFDVSKLRHSLKRSKADPATINKVVAEIEGILHEGMSTKQIYRQAFQMLSKTAPHTAARYKLKKALFELGPTGFPFERYVAAILDHEGYETEVSVIVHGHCVDHEIDVIAQKDDQHFMIECKFHSEEGRNCSVKIPLYIRSRFVDVESNWSKKPGHSTKFHQGWVVTNTRFSSDAIQFGSCMGLYLLSWNQPYKGNLKERIDESGLHPVTCLTTLTTEEKQKILDKRIVLCKELCADPSLLKQIGISENRSLNILKEANELCMNPKEKSNGTE